MSSHIVAATFLSVFFLRCLSAPVSARQELVALPVLVEAVPLTIDEELITEETIEPTMEEEIQAMPSMEPIETSPGFYYNVGGGATSMFEADPEDWIVGETAIFDIPEAEIVGEGDTEIYKTHRYGLLGSTWGYDVPVEMPGVYDCTLYYAETFSEFFSDEPNRTFTVEIGGDAGVTQTETFDVMVELEGQEFTEYKRYFTGIAIQSMLSIREIPTIGDAFLSAFSCNYSGPLIA